MRQSDWTGVATCSLMRSSCEIVRFAISIGDNQEGVTVWRCGQPAGGAAHSFGFVLFAALPGALQSVMDLPMGCL